MEAWSQWTIGRLVPTYYKRDEKIVHDTQNQRGNITFLEVFSFPYLFLLVSFGLIPEKCLLTGIFFNSKVSFPSYGSFRDLNQGAMISSLSDGINSISLSITKGIKEKGLCIILKRIQIYLQN